MPFSVFVAYLEVASFDTNKVAVVFRDMSKVGADFGSASAIRHGEDIVIG